MHESNRIEFKRELNDSLEKEVVASGSEKPYYLTKMGMSAKGCYIRVGNAAELMRVFRDLDMVEHMGSGVPRILEHYQRSIYHFSRNFIRVVLSFTQGFEQVTEQINKVIQFCITPKSTAEIMKYLSLSHREHFRSMILAPLIMSGRIALTIPDKPNSSKQKYITV